MLLKLCIMLDIVLRRGYLLVKPENKDLETYNKKTENLLGNIKNNISASDDIAELLSKISDEDKDSFLNLYLNTIDGASEYALADFITENDLNAFQDLINDIETKSKEVETFYKLQANSDYLTSSKDSKYKPKRRFWSVITNNVDPKKRLKIIDGPNQNIASRTLASFINDSPYNRIRAKVDFGDYQKFNDNEKGFENLVKTNFPNYSDKKLSDFFQT